MSEVNVTTPATTPTAVPSVEQPPVSSGVDTPVVEDGRKTGATGLAQYLLSKMSETATPPSAEPVTPTTETPPAQPEVTPTTATTEPILGKFKSVDDVVKSYQELEKWNARLAQRHGLPAGLDAQKSILEQYQQAQAELANIKSAQQTVPPPQTAESQAPAEASGDNLGLSAEEFNDLLYTDPMKLQKLLTERAQKAAQLAIEKHQTQQRQADAERQKQIDNWTDQIYQTSAKYPDLREMFPRVEAYIAQNPALEKLPNAVELAYKAVKADELSGKVAQYEKQLRDQPKTADDIMKNENLRNQLMQHPELLKALNAQLAQAVIGNKPPAVIAGAVAGIPPALPKSTITNAREATKAAKEYFARRPQQ